ncbi:MAG: serine/threonine-protein kinase [Bradymonadia bacterium]|jgi:serine/threonine-protein kinase
MTAHDDTLPAMLRPDSITTEIIERVANRYDVLSILGVGAFGSVYRGFDTVTKREVALKFFRAFGKKDLDRFRRETATLRLLRLPGVVEVLDDGVTSDGMPWVAMALVDGRPFPGEARKHTWIEIAEATRGLLEALARVHHLGVLHLDLKPDNILVDSVGRVTLLDFGISNSPRHRKVTEIAGTPAYIAPEQVLRRKIDERADIFAIGVMLFEALTGQRPFDTDTLTMVMATRTVVEAPSIREFGTNAPAHVLETVDRMLAVSPRARPRYAEDVMEMLGHPTTSSPNFRLGPPSYLQDLVALVELGTPDITVGGGPGTGHTRLLADLAAALKLRGEHQMSAWPPVPGTDVCFVDDGDRVSMSDRRSAQQQGTILIRSVNSPGADVELEPLTIEELQDLFHGPELVLSLKSRSATELHRRTGGIPAAVMAELAAWMRSGICFWDEGRVRIDHLALNRLGLTDTALAGMTGDGPKRRRGRTVVRQEPAASTKIIDSAQVAREAEAKGLRTGAAEALRQSYAALEAGIPGLAFIASDWAMRLGAACGADWLRREALYARVTAALSLAEPNPIEVVLYEIAQAGSWCPETNDLSELCNLTLRGVDPSGEITVRELPTDALEHLRHGLFARQMVHSKGANTKAGRILVEWAEGNVDRTRRVAGWIGSLRYTQLKFDESIDWHMYAAETDNLAQRLASLQNAGTSAIEVSKMELALKLSQTVELQARHLFPRLSTRAVIQRVHVGYRLGRDLDQEWPPILELANLIGESFQHAAAYLFAAAEAWRRGDLVQAGTWAAYAAELWATEERHTSAATLASALASLCAGQIEDGQTLLNAAVKDPLPGTRLQSLALLVLAGVEVDDAGTLARTATRQLSDPRPELRREVLSTTECARILGLDERPSAFE